VIFDLYGSIICFIGIQNLQPANNDSTAFANYLKLMTFNAFSHGIAYLGFIVREPSVQWFCPKRAQA
jgi:hypothetical protein